VATATPSPNEYIELLAYAEVLGVMDIGQAKTRFFKRNSEKADQLTLHPHKEREFWLWVASWALFISSRPTSAQRRGLRPAADAVRWHEVAVDRRLGTPAGVESGQGAAVPSSAKIGVVGQAREKRSTLSRGWPRWRRSAPPTRTTTASCGTT
jgi:hypothetical protein